MTPSQIQERVSSATFGVLATVDAITGTHAVPVVFAIEGDQLVAPIDTVKAKRSDRLRRVTNLEADSRASLLVDHRDDDWAELWWVRLDIVFEGQQAPSNAWTGRLANKYPAYEAEGSIASLLVFAVNRKSGWRASNISR